MIEFGQMMRSAPSREGLFPDRIYDHHLSPASPIWVAATHDYPPTPFDIHTHQGFEIGLALSGEVEVIFGSTRVIARAGDVWLCNAWEPHGDRLTARRNSLIACVFLPEFIGEGTAQGLPWLSMFAAPPGQRPHSPSPQVRDLVISVGGEIEREAVRQEPLWDTMVWLGLLRILAALKRGWQPAPEVSRRVVAQASDYARVTPAVTLVHANLPLRTSVSDAAKACGFSPPHFRLLFRRTLGLSFGSFCLRARLSYVARRLLTTRAALRSLAKDAGFSDASHLHHAFLKHFGCTTAQFREHGIARPSFDYDERPPTRPADC